MARYGSAYKTTDIDDVWVQGMPLMQYINILIRQNCTPAEIKRILAEQGIHVEFEGTNNSYGTYINSEDFSVVSDDDYVNVDNDPFYNSNNGSCQYGGNGHTGKHNSNQQWNSGGGNRGRYTSNTSHQTSRTSSRQTSSSPGITRLQSEMESLGYYPTKAIAMETYLNLNKITKPKVGQKIHAFCLSGPPGAGKSFYVETYEKLLRQRTGNDVKLISYQCHAKTSESNLYEDINIAAAIKGDSDKVIISGKLIQAIDEANKGNIVIVFLDEYDKAGEEVDTFLLNFLQEGVIDTTQRGKVSLSEDCMQNLQVFLCKNNARETLSGPLTRRLKFLELDYMTPENLCKVVDRKLGHIDSALRNAVTLLYTAMYQTLPGHGGDDSAFEFSRIPAASECMQAIEDAWELMEIGADQSDIVLNGIVANLVKTAEDIEQFKELTKSNSELVIWYNYLMNAIGSSNENIINNVKQQMARDFFPEAIREATRDLEESVRRRREELQAEYRGLQGELQRKIQEAEQKLEGYEQKLAALQKQKEALDKREQALIQESKTVKQLRENAASDAKDGADRYLQAKEQELAAFRKETENLRKNAAKDALDEAKRELAKDRAQLEADIQKEQQRITELISQAQGNITQQIEEANNQIRQHNLSISEATELSTIIAGYQAELAACKKLVEQMLGRPITEGDLVNIQIGDNIIPAGDNGGFQQTTNNNGEVQTASVFNRSGSVFDVSKDGMWVDIGEITLENRSDKNMVLNSDFFKNLISAYETNGVYQDGIIIHNGTKVNIIAVRSIDEQEDNGKTVFQNKFKFYANSTVLSKYALLDLCNFIMYITPGGKYLPATIKIGGKEGALKFTKPISAKMNCMVYSSDGYREIDNQTGSIKNQGNNVYLVSYKSEEHKQLECIAKDIHKMTGCSKSDVSQSKITTHEQEAYIAHSRNLGAKGLVQNVHEEVDLLK